MEELFPRILEQREKMDHWRSCLPPEYLSVGRPKPKPVFDTFILGHKGRDQTEGSNILISNKITISCIVIERV